MRRRFRPKKVQRNDKTKLRTNEEIRIPEVFVIDENGENVGTMPTRDALNKARELGLDLVEVSPKANPSVCRIIDYGKFQYQRSKKSAKQRQKKVEVKGIRIGLRTDTHDLEFKKKQAEKFLSKGNKVKIDIQLRGREKAHQDLARKNLTEFVSSIEIPHKTEEPIKRGPMGFTTTIAPE